ncbi:dnaJ homolog subfamily C member 17 isoform X3 [Gymnogyps californianus]|uniref:dnaJ homolog subfamily C member 17 isoform X3 n=1 Tax=Gymnogyps californianus TaxID=33616 RepID=UPI0021C9594A|nr:dnaJ homolog subfamily C member 17 isoform X3 [Gymnogyps californianus]
MAVDKDLLQLDLYGLLGVGEKASEKEVKKAYRQKALTCHPDKNPDNPRAAEVFHQLSQALAVLTDAAARAAYDKVRKAKKQAAERTQKLDEKRKKVKLDLEAREREAQTHESEEEEIRITRSLEQEIIRLREEGSRQLEEQQRLIQEQIRLEREQHIQGKQERNGAEGKITPKLKLKWKCRKEDETRGGYSKDVLLQILQKYGDVLNLLISSRKTGSAVVEFATVKAAEMAVKNEVGLINNPLKISWLEGQPRNNPSTVLSDSTSQPRTSQMQLLPCSASENSRRPAAFSWQHAHYSSASELCLLPAWSSQPGPVHQSLQIKDSHTLTRPGELWKQLPGESKADC